MAIVKTSNVLVETAPIDLDQYVRTGVMRADQFSFCDKVDRTKQAAFDVSNLATGTAVSLNPPATSGKLGLHVNAIQYATPVTTNTVTILAGNSTLVIEPAGTLAALTIVMPTTPADESVVNICSTKILTSITHNAGGADTLNGALTAFAAANAFARYIYKTSTTSWYRIG